MSEPAAGQQSHYRLVVADDHGPFRESLRDIFSDDPSVRAIELGLVSGSEE